MQYTMTDNNTSERKPLILIAEDVESNYKLLEIILKKEYNLLRQGGCGVCAIAQSRRRTDGY